MQYVSPNIIHVRVDVSRFKDLPKPVFCLEIVAPKKAKTNQGNTGYVPVKKRFEMITLSELSAVLSLQTLVP